MYSTATYPVRTTALARFNATLRDVLYQAFITVKPPSSSIV